MLSGPQPRCESCGWFLAFEAVNGSWVARCYNDPERCPVDVVAAPSAGVGVGMPAWLKLNQFGRVLEEAFDATAYLVGSAAKGKGWRDVDVRVILNDDEFERICGPLTRPRALNLRWNALCLSFAALGRDMTGLPIDFQIDQQTDANEKYDGPRHALIFATEIAAHA